MYKNKLAFGKCPPLFHISTLRINVPLNLHNLCDLLISVSHRHPPRGKELSTNWNLKKRCHKRPGAYVAYELQPTKHLPLKCPLERTRTWSSTPPFSKIQGEVHFLLGSIRLCQLVYDARTQQECFQCRSDKHLRLHMGLLSRDC